MRKVTGNEHVSRFEPKTVAKPLRRIVRLEIARRRQLCQRIARPPERFRGLSRSQFPAVPDDRWPGATGVNVRGEPFDNALSGW